ncbi:MAG: hypothetical protein LBL07_08835 [Tannerella sp.]|jgi:hypothetical protein|nr:hypothetical protein [Tannerella sp.]
MRDAVDHDRVVRRETGVVFLVVARAVRLAVRAFGREHQAFAVHFERNAVCVRVIAVGAGQRGGRNGRRLVDVEEEREHRPPLSPVVNTVVHHPAEHACQFRLALLLAVFAVERNEHLEGLRTQGGVAGVAERRDAAVGEEVLHPCRHGLADEGEGVEHVDLPTGGVVDERDDLQQVVADAHRVRRRFVPQAGLRVERLADHFLQCKLPYRGVVQYFVQVILLSAPVNVMPVVFERERDVGDVARLEDVPVVVRHAVQDLLLGKPLEHAGNHLLLRPQAVMHEIVAQRPVNVVNLRERNKKSHWKLLQKYYFRIENKK